MRVLHDIVSAVRLLTVLPLRGGTDGRPVRWLAAVGWVYGGLALGMAAVARALGATTGPAGLLVAALVVAAWGLLSGFLHWDGLADVADGMGARGGAEARLAVMRDSATGAFGVAAVTIVVLVQTAALACVLASGEWWGLLAAPVLGRFAAAAALIQTRPARPDGLAARLAGPESAAGVAAIAASLAPLVAFPPVHARFVAAVAGVAAGQLIPMPMVRRLGGTTGDVLGATVLLTETAVLVWCALVPGGV